jgi:glycosyltransferase involved in cell wall biosynthesis
LLVPVRDANAISDALASLVDDSALRGRLGAAAAAKAVDELDQRQIDLTLATCERLLAGC